MFKKLVCLALSLCVATAYLFNVQSLNVKASPTSKTNNSISGNSSYNSYTNDKLLNAIGAFLPKTTFTVASTSGKGISPYTRIMKPDQDGPCPSYGIHDMVSRGFGWLYVNNTLAYTGCIWQCSGCMEVLFTQYDPISDTMIGHWTTWNPGYQTSGYGCVIKVGSYSAIKYTTGRTLSGFRFRYPSQGGL